MDPRQKRHRNQVRVERVKGYQRSIIGHKKEATSSMLHDLQTANFNPQPRNGAACSPNLCY
jgi:hypothetical protein